MPKIGKIIGPPGTGKTTEIMRLIEAAAKKYHRDRIGAISFTKAAVETIGSRIMNTNGEIPDNVRTIHGQAFRLLQLKKDQICDNTRKNKRLQEFCNKYPQWELSASHIEGDDDDFSYDHSTHDNDLLFQDMQIARHQMVPFERWDDRMQALYRDWMDYLNENDLIDFTGILEKCYRMQLAPQADVLFIDEAQDLTALQYCLTRMWAERADHALYVGDSDQCLYRWAGVSPEVFMNIEHSWFKLLDQSYRVPRKILNFAQDIIRNISHREDVTYKPDERDGPGEVIAWTSEPDLSLPGTHMILTRCNYQVRKWVNYLRRNNTAWHNPYREKDTFWNPALTKSWKAYALFQKVIKGQGISGYELQDLVDQMRVEPFLPRGLKAKIGKWDRGELSKKYDSVDLALLGFSNAFLDGDIPIADWSSGKQRNIEYLADIYTEQAPKVIVGTCHSVKGGEADHVWIDSESTRTICDAVSNDIGGACDDEARVYYVAATRAKKTLGILSTRSPLKAPYIC